MSEFLRTIAIYKRVSSDEQREKESIRTQADVIDRYLATHPDVEVYLEYSDDGVSGTIPIGQRPEGRRLIEDAMHGRFQEIWVTRPDRLGRDPKDMLHLWALMESLGILLVGIAEPIGDEFMFGIQAVVSGADRKRFLARSAEGMALAAKEGRYCGGIVPLGYKTVGERKKRNVYLVPSDIPIWGETTEAGLVQQIYHWLAIERWSCRKIAEHMNALSIPTVYTKDGRTVQEKDGLGGRRERKTQNKWRPGRIRNLVVNPVYRGTYQYGRRSKRRREIIESDVEPLVSAEVWTAAQQTLVANRIMAKNTRRHYLLRSVVKCGLCGLNFCGSMNRGKVWYRCDGQLVERGTEGKCNGKSFRGDVLEDVIWRDIERFLWDPGELLDELVSERHNTSAAAIAEAQRLSLASAIKGKDEEREIMLDALRHKDITRDDFARTAGKIEREKRELQDRLAELEPAAEEPVALDLLTDLRERLADLDDQQRGEIVRLLVRIKIKTEVIDDGSKNSTAIVEYRFPAVVDDHPGRGSAPR